MTQNLKTHNTLALESFDTLPASAHVRLPVVAALNGVSHPTIWRWVKAGRLPSPVKLGANTTAWRVGDLREFMQGQSA
ncbi:helix-turn-helix transcriptional regulator [Undibacterium sp. SXout11W]|uniref:helix-turn-helix transcriptional regulator n=1 Tax=Undibacterium sp. SXout11W TaxID=3413050 RepID=UPI003BF13E76